MHGPAHGIACYCSTLDETIFQWFHAIHFDPTANFCRPSANHRTRTENRLSSPGDMSALTNAHHSVARNRSSPVLDTIQTCYTNFCMKDFAELLRIHGVQVTAQRLAALRAVSANPHCTADEVAESVRSVIGTVSRQAVYDALKLLAEKRLIRRIQSAGSPARYEDRVGDNHHHLICRQCGKTVDVDCSLADTSCATVKDHEGYEIDEAEVIYWGTCADCRVMSPKIPDK